MSSGQQWGTVVGGIVGAWVGSYSGNTMQGAQIGMAIGGYAGSVIDPTIIKGPSIGDASQQTSMGGVPIPKVYGHSPPIAPTLIDGDKIARKVFKEEDVGKGATSKTRSEGWVATRAFLVCEGEIEGYARITRNGKLVYSTIAGDQIDADSASFAGQITIYKGDETQGPDPSLEAIHGVGNTPYYRGRSYFVVRDDDETQSGGAANQYRVEVIASGASSTVCTEVDAEWSHGDTGLEQHIWDIEVNDQNVFLVSGWNNNLRRSTDGVNFVASPYIATTGWSSGTAITNLWYWAAEEQWHMSIADEIAYSQDQGQSWGIYGTPVYEINERSVGEIGGQFWAGATNATDSTTIFMPLLLGTTVEESWGNHGWPSAIAQIEGVTYVGTSAGKILNAPNSVVYEHTDPEPIRQISGGNGVVIAALSSGGYARAADGDPEFVFHSSASVFGVVFANNQFYRALGRAIETSPDGLAWTEVDDSFQDNETASLITAQGSLVFATTLFGDVTAVSPILYPLPDIAGAYVDEDGNISGICNDRIIGDAAIWKDIVTDIAGRASPLLPDRLDIDHMTDEVPGFVLGNATLTGTDYVRTLCTWYTTDGPEYDGQIHFVRRGGAIVATFSDDDALVIEDEDDDTRNKAVDGIKRLTVMYPDPANQYVTTPQTSPRTSPDVTASNNVTIQCPIPFDADTMAEKADILQKIAFLPLEGGFKRAMPAEFSKYVSSDPIMFNDRRYLIGRTSNDDSMVSFEATYDRVSAYTSRATGSTGPAPTPQTSNIKGPTIFFAANLPRTRTSENVPGIHVGGCGLLEGWPGADLYLSVDGGVSEQLVLRMTNEATLGRLTSDITASGEPIPVKLYPHGELESITAAQLSSRLNAFAIKRSSSGEVGQFQTADEVTDQNYELTDTFRGQLGTTATAHPANSQFALLDSGIYFLPLDASLIGKVLIFRPVTLGTVPMFNPTYAVLFDPLFTGPEVVDFLETNTGERITTNDGSFIQVTHA